MVSLALVSCASTTLQGYEGPARPDSQTALLSVESQSRNQSSAALRIVSIDTPRGEPIPITARRVRLLARETCIEVRASSSSGAFLLSDLCFEPYAGSRYELRASTSGAAALPGIGPLDEFEQGPFDVIRVVLIDLSTREIVADTNP